MNSGQGERTGPKAYVVAIAFLKADLWQEYGSDAGESIGGGSVNTIPNSNLLAKTLLIVSSTSLAKKPTHCARLLLLSHNPCIATGRHKDVIWKVSSTFSHNDEGKCCLCPLLP